MLLAQQDINVLLKSAETTGDSCLQLCQFLANHGVNVGAESTKIHHIVLELQRLLTLSTAHPRPVVASKASSTIRSGLLYPDLGALIKPCILQPNDPRIAKINNLHVLMDLQHAVRVGIARSEFPVGSIISDIWTDREAGIVYLMPFIVVDYREVKLVDHSKRPGAILLRQNALPFEPRFDKSTTVFAESELKYWLNSDPEGYSTGCSDSLLEVISDILIDNEVVVNFFPPSLEEVHLDPYDNPELESLVWEYFRDTPTKFEIPCAKRVFLDPLGTAQFCWLRSAFRDFTHHVWTTRTDGRATPDFVCSTRYACAPACVVI